MAQVKEITTSGGGSSSSSASSKSSSSSASGSYSKPSSSSSNSSSSKASSKAVSSAASNARAAIQAGRAGALAKKQSQVGQTQAARYVTRQAVASSRTFTGEPRTTQYSQNGSGISRDNISEQAQTKLGTKQQVTNEEQSYLAAAINGLADKMYKGEEFNRNSYTDEAFAMASQINQGWKNGVGQTAVVKNGKVVVEADKDMPGNEHYWYSLGEDGKKVATQNAAHREENLKMLNNDIQRWADFANSGNFTRADVIKESAGVKQWMNAIDNGLVENFQMEDGTTARDYLQSLFEGREDLLTSADRQTAIKDYNALATKYTDTQNGLAQGLLYGDIESLATDRETLQNYAAKYADDEELGAAFGNLATGYYDLYNLARRQEYDHLSAKVDRLDEEFTKAELHESDLKDMAVVGETEDPGAYERAVADTKKARDAYDAAKAELDSWAPNTNERRDELIAKMHANAGFMRGGLTEEEQMELLELDAQLFNPDIDYGKDFTRRGAAAANILKQGAAGIARTGSSALNFVVNGVPKVFNGISDWLVDHSDFARDVDALASELFRPAKETAEWFETGISGQQEKYAEEGYANISGDKVAEFFNKYGPEAIQMIPMAMVAYATAGTSAGAAFGATQAGDTIQAASQIAQATGLEQLGLMVGNALKTTASDPNFQTAFMQELGGNYNEAIEDGASDAEAVAYALLCSFLNSEIEVGGGIQNMPESMKDAVSSGKKDVLLAYAKSMVEEGFEEVKQGAVGSALKGMYQPTEILSTTNQNAIINPLRAVEEFKGGAIGAAFLGAPTTAVNAIRAPGKMRGALTVDESGRIIPASGSPVTKGNNRHDTATGVLAEGFEDAGYVNSTNADEDYNTATTGAEERGLSAEEADEQSRIQAQEETGARLAAEEEARQAEETKRKEDAELDEQSRVREQEAEGARRAAQAFQDEQNAQLEAAQEAEKYAQLAHNAREFEAEQEFIRKAQQARQAAEEAGRKAEEQLAIANSQSATLEGQDTSPVEAPKSTDLATASETAQGAQAESTQANTQENPQPSVKLEANERGEDVTSEELKADAKAVVTKIKDAITKNGVDHHPVIGISSDTFQKKAGEKLTDKVGQFFRELGNKVVSKALGGKEVVIDEQGIRSDIAHGLGKAKAATFAAVPKVLEEGLVIDTQYNWKKRGYDTKIIAAPITIDKKTAYVGCVVSVVKENGAARYYLHEVVDGNGDIIYSFDGMASDASKKSSDVDIQTGIANNGDTSSTSELNASIAQNPQVSNSTNSSTNTQTDGTIETKGVMANDSQANTSNETLVSNSNTTGANSGIQEKGGRVGKTRASQVSGEARTRLDAELSTFKARGRETLSDAEYTDSMRELEDFGNCAVSFAVGGNEDYGPNGFTDSSDDSFGVIVAQAEDSAVEAGETAIHEITHFRLHNFTPKVPNYVSVPSRLKYIAKNVMPSSYYARARALFAQNWADLYLTDYLTAGEIRAVQSMRTPNDVLRFLGNKLSEPVYWAYMNAINEEMTCELNAGQYFWFEGANFGELTGCEEATKLVRTALMNDGVFDQGSLDNVGELISRVNKDVQALIDKKAEAAFENAKNEAKPVLAEDQPSSREQALQEENEALKQRIAELEAAQQTQVQEEPVPAEEQQEKPQTGRTPGRVKQSQSAFEQDVATKGERANTDAAMGEAEFLSRTNEARSRTADALTEDPDSQVAQQKKDAQVQRLLKEDYVWNDDDVVIAQKVMFDMVKAIRDYQLKKTSKMKPEAFKRMTEQYNQLMTKHQQKLSAAGQELQANYMFSTGDKIVMKAAQTFLGFTKDGRFAGASVNAKNAKIYAGIEEASKRIQKAVDAEDVQGLAKICKDISNIRNVKKMFGPLGGYASEMEARVLDKIAKGENAAQNLENLAYGNLNAVCDDVQPYKALNAAKTIRVMNMLSNTATIVNNLANNFAQGAVNRSRVNQAFNSLAAKPFAALTGQEVLSQTARGKEARQAVRNAKMEALETATLMQMYGITEENGRLELNDRGMFNPNINPFEQTMSLYKFLTGMGVEATDKMQAAGMLKEMELGIDADIKAKKIEAHTKEQRMQEARHEVNRLLYKDDNSTTALVQHIRDFLNKWSVGNDRIGTIGVGDITMAFAKIPANVVRARLAMTPEGALLQVAQYARGVNKAKRMHAEVLARGIVEAYQERIDTANASLQAAYEMKRGTAKDMAIQKARSELSKLNSRMWSEAQNACRGSVYKNLRTIAQNYNENMMFNEAVERAGYMNAKEMSQFEAAQLSRKIGRAAMSAGMMVLGSVLRAAGALRDFDQEPDDELRKMNSDKGYRGLMMNLSAIGRKNHEWKDGDLIIDGEFLEVIAMPLTIGATAAEAAATAQDAKTWSWLKSMAGNGIAKTFEAVGDIPGMADAINMYESLTSAYNTDYDERVNRLGAGLLQYAANTVPSFFMPNSISQAAAGFDNKVRDVYTADSAWGQAANIFKNKFPGLRNTIPVSVDVWGNERTYGEGLWGAVNKMLLPGDIHVYRKNKYEAEIERMVKAGYGNATPKTTVNSSFEVGDEKYTMTAQEKLDFKAARNNQQREFFEAFIDSDYYQQLNDAERMKVFQSLKTSAERDAKQDMLNGRQLNVEITRDKWETELTDVNDQLQFLAAKQMAGRVWDTNENAVSDYAAMDDFLANEYNSLSNTQKELLVNSFSRLDDLADARKEGINSEKWQAAQNIYSYFTRKDEEGHQVEPSNLTTSSEMWAQIQKATGFSDSGKEMKYLQEKMDLTYVGTVNTENYDELIYDYGMSRESAAKVYSAFDPLTPTEGYATVQDRQKWKVLPSTGLSDKEQWDTFFALVPSNNTNQIRNMTNLRGKMNPRTLKPYTFAEAIHELGLDIVYWKEVLANGKEKKHELK